MKKQKINTVIVFVIACLIINGFLSIQVKRQRATEEYKASYTAEITVRRIESQLNRYLAKTDLLKKMIQSGTELTDTQFDKLASYMMDDDGVLQAIELAKDGTVSQVYPLESNRQAMGLDFFTDPERKVNSTLARESGEYTIAGPFDLVQGGTGALLFDPIYRTAEDENVFWGFALLVIDWNTFTDGLGLDNLEDASYQYQIWKKNATTGEKIILVEGTDAVSDDAIEVPCEVPNDVWYFEIAPKDGWYSRSQLILNYLLSLAVSLLFATIYWQYAVRRYKDAIYTEQIRKTADEAKAANAAKTNFLARMSHDIRTPLNGIIGLLKIDEQHPDDAALIRANRGKMLIAANHLLSLINDVLQMSKLEAGELVLAREVIDLNEMTVDILTIVEQRAAEAGVTMEYDPNSDVPPYNYVYGSPLHIRQLFLNIYSNCIKYNHVGGKVTLTFQDLGEKDGITTYRWIIADNGIGMSEEFQKHIFEPFAQEHADARSIYHGTGLGMAIVESLIEKMNGSIEVHSRLGEGSTFLITLPLEIAEEPESETEKVPSASIRGLHFLLAEDNDLNAEIAEMLLQDEGASVTLVKDGLQAINCFRNHPEGTFDAILMDIMMPNMDGITATRHIRALDRPDAKQIPIIAMTANAFAEDARKCMEAGMNAHLSKPLQMEKVVATIAACCKRVGDKTI